MHFAESHLWLQLPQGQMAALLTVILERDDFWYLQPLTNLIAEKDPRSHPVRGFSLYYSTRSTY